MAAIDDIGHVWAHHWNSHEPNPHRIDAVIQHRMVHVSLCKNGLALISDKGRLWSTNIRRNGRMKTPSVCDEEHYQHGGLYEHNPKTFNNERLIGCSLGEPQDNNKWEHLEEDPRIRGAPTVMSIHAVVWSEVILNI